MRLLQPRQLAVMSLSQLVNGLSVLSCCRLTGGLHGQLQLLRPVFRLPGQLIAIVARLSLGGLPKRFQLLTKTRQLRIPLRRQLLKLLAVRPLLIVERLFSGGDLLGQSLLILRFEPRLRLAMLLFHCSLRRCKADPLRRERRFRLRPHTHKRRSMLRVQPLALCRKCRQLLSMPVEQSLLLFRKLGQQSPRLAFESLAQKGDVFIRTQLFLLGVLQPTLEALFPLEELFAIDRQRLKLLLQPQLFSLQRQVALFRLATLVLLLARLFTGIQNLPLFEIRRVAQIEDVLVLLVDDLAQVDDLAIA